MEALRHLGTITGIMGEGEMPGFGDWVALCLARLSWQRLSSRPLLLRGRLCMWTLSRSVMRTGRK